MFKVKCGPTSFFDVDSTLVEWNIPSYIDAKDPQLVEIECRGKFNLAMPNRHNIDLLVKMASRGHSIVVWSAGGSDWCESVVLGLGLEDYVDVVTGKPSYYIDDKPNPKDWMGAHGFFNLDGKRINHKEK